MSRDTERAPAVNVFELLRRAGAEMDNHESDLYVRATPTVLAIVRSSGWNWSTFRSEIDGETWIEVPFAFYPWWQQREVKP